MLQLVAPFETPWGKLSAGTKGFVEYMDEQDGLIQVLMEGDEPALYGWNNRLVLVPFDTEDLVERLVCRSVKSSVNVAQLRTG